MLSFSSLAQWHQWLRALRTEAPTIAEQEAEIRRVQQLKAAALLADQRWAQKPSLLNAAPHPPEDSVLEKNTKWSNDSGLQRNQDVGRGVVGDVGRGSGKEIFSAAGEGSERRVHGRESMLSEEERMKINRVENVSLPHDKGKAREEVGPGVEAWAGGGPPKVRSAMSR